MTLLAYSSNSRDIYKADIYRALSLPNGYIMHFRYKGKYVQDSILSNENSRKHVMIIFTEASSLGESTNNVAIRSAIVTKTEYSEATEVFHLYMKLQDFCDIKTQSIPDDKKPPEYYLSEIDKDYLKPLTSQSNWKKRIDILNGSFSPKIYYHLESITQSNNIISPKSHITQKNSYYELTYGNEYFINLKIANPDGSEHTIELKHDESSICTSVTNPIRTSLQYDDLEIPTSIRLLQEHKQICTLKFLPMNGDSEIKEYSSVIEMRLKKSKRSAVLFGAFASLGLLGILLSRSDSCIYFNTIGIFLFFGAACFLYFWHNKK
ncbi:hypothetical protein [Cobetia amphilecti]|uniref:Uncharacterized protein n=1 Tax=Cobetia amphilecti TaxID=1055104 RepID=A0AAP4TXI5_9GAMM|nr:hypothetical protein [Cobetia amphilecti]MDO6672139.1 hypothetical protein [Cobetia amphilecti]